MTTPETPAELWARRHMSPSAGNWWLCERCHYSVLMPANSPAPVCPECASTPTEVP